MKKLINLLTAVLILLALCACSNNRNTNNGVSKTAETSTVQESITEETEMADKFDNTITVTVGDKVFSAQLYDNETAKAFYDMLPLTLNMNELHGNEKYYNLSNSLPTDSLNIGIINNGDIMLYGNNCIVLFYDSFSTEYSYTEIGYIENPAALADAVGDDNITITFEK